MKHKSTPGPWKVGDGCIVSESKSVKAASMVCYAPEEFTDCMKYWPANSKLISATPDLVRVCQDAINYLGSFYAKWDEAERVLSAELQAALDKATKNTVHKL